MGYKITETPTKANEKRPFATGVYNITGVELKTIQEFWDYLMLQGEIEGYEIEKTK